MARPLRLEFEGALYHVMARGNARQAIFVDDKDRAAFVANLGRGADRNASTPLRQSAHEFTVIFAPR